jgi:hypothetical protein
VTFAVGSHCSRVIVGSSLGSAQRDGGAVATRDFVGERKQEEVLVWHVLLASEDEALGERVEETTELEATKDGGELGRDGVERRHRALPSSLAETDESGTSA